MIHHIFQETVERPGDLPKEASYARFVAHSFDPLPVAPADPRFRSFGWGPVELPSDICIHFAVERQIKARPEAIAVEHLGQSISYRELDRRASLLARRLAALGVGRGDAVGLFLRRGIPMVIGILSILRLGAAYVPQDVKICPGPMLRQVMDGADINIVLSTSDWMSAIPVRTGDLLLDIDDCSDGEALLPEFVPPSLSGTERCFILFTSGTTGVPNGVQVTHANVCNLLLTKPGDLCIRPGMRVGQILNIGFDMAAWEILGCLSHGGTLVIRDDDIAATAKQVNVLIATPSILARLEPENCPDIAVVALAGEPCPRPLADRWAGRCSFYNGCGPTEVTIVNTLARYRKGDAVLSIGAPTPNNTVYVLDQDLAPCRIGDKGEMWAGGDCVTAGYLKNPQLNAERYRPDPFLGGGRMMFRTRDLGRWNDDGTLEHLGRVDDQVKIHGFRVELDAVSRLLEGAPGCVGAVTLKVGEHDLVSFVAPITADTVSARQRVEQALPYYYVPTLVIPLDSLPMTQRGKVDRRLLEELAIRHLRGKTASVVGAGARVGMVR